LERIRNSRWSLEQSLNIESTGTQNTTPMDDWDDIMEYVSYRISLGADPSDYEDYKQNWEERSIQITIPLRIKYDFEKWLIIHAGLSNTFIMDGDEYFTINKSYVLRGEAGVDILLGKKLFAGIIYSHDLTPCAEALDYSFYFQNLSFRIGYKLK
jgi:hypothetical protein